MVGTYVDHEPLLYGLRSCVCGLGVDMSAKGAGSFARWVGWCYGFESLGWLGGTAAGWVG